VSPLRIKTSWLVDNFDSSAYQAIQRQPCHWRFGSEREVVVRLAGQTAEVGWKSPVHLAFHVVRRPQPGLTVGQAVKVRFEMNAHKLLRHAGGGARHNRTSPVDGQRSLRNRSVVGWRACSHM
jgi:hypothetical protein